jgi:hypothetical protein
MALVSRHFGSIVVVIAALFMLFPQTAASQKELKKGQRIHLEDGGPVRTQMYEELEAAAELPYHNGETLVCSDCHTMHASMQHNYAGGTEAEGNIDAFP